MTSECNLSGQEYVATSSQQISCARWLERGIIVEGYVKTRNSSNLSAFHALNCGYSSQNMIINQHVICIHRVRPSTTPYTRCMYLVAGVSIASMPRPTLNLVRLQILLLQNVNKDCAEDYSLYHSIAKS